MATLIPKYDQGATGAVNRAINLKLAESISVKDFGATGNGSTDDTAAIQAALTYANTIGGCKVFIPTGTYLCSSSLLIYKNTLLEGQGRTTSILKFTNSGDGIQSTWTINSSIAVNIVIRDLYIYGTNVSSTGGGFADVGGTFLELTNVKITGFKYGIILDQSEIVAINKCDIESWTTAGVWLVNGADHTVGANNNYTNRISISDCQFNNSATGYCIADDGGSNHSYLNNNFNGSGTQIHAAGVYGLTIQNNEFEGASAYGIILTETKINSSFIAPVYGFSIKDNTLGNGTASEITLSACHDGVIEGNVLYQYTSSAIVYDFGPNERISGITIQSNSKVLTGAGKTATPFILSLQLPVFYRQGNVTQKEEQYVALAVGSTGSQTVTPAAMDGITVGGTLLCVNSDGTNPEIVRVTAITSTTFTATFASTKSANWTLFVQSYGWLPVMTGASTNTPASWTYSVQQASYQLVGNRVIFDAIVTWSATGGTGQLQMSLPFTAANVANKYSYASVSLQGAAGIYTGTPFAAVNPDTAVISFGAINNTTGAANVISSYATGTAAVSGSYEI